MKILYCIQRYGESVIGGAEQHCRLLAENMVARGHHVEVVTSCATNYSDWEDDFTPGTTTINGVTVHRLSVIAPRDNERFSPLHVHLTQGRRTPTFEQKRWARMIGPELVNYESWIRQHAEDFDVVVIFSYLYTTTTKALEILYGHVPTAIHATAHDEPMLHIPWFQTVMRWPDQFVFSTPEEKNLVEKTFSRDDAGPVVGLGVDQDIEMTDEMVAEFRTRRNLGQRPFLLYIGRADPTKGFYELISYFTAHKALHPSDLQLVMIGGTDESLSPHPDIHMLGFVSESEKWAALRGALALVHPSYQESLSMVLCEAWSQRTPVIVQNACEVLRGQTLRSQGGLRFADFPEFDAAVSWLSEDSDLRQSLGESGRRYVEDNYTWDVVMKNYETALESTRARFLERHGRGIRNRLSRRPLRSMA